MNLRVFVSECKAKLNFRNSLTRKTLAMQVTFLNGGYLNEQGPFEPGATVSVSEADALQLIADGVAQAIQPIRARPITITIAPITFDSKTEGADHV